MRFLSNKLIRTVATNCRNPRFNLHHFLLFLNRKSSVSGSPYSSHPKVLSKSQKLFSRVSFPNLKSPRMHKAQSASYSPLLFSFWARDIIKTRSNGQKEKPFLCPFCAEQMQKYSPLNAHTFLSLIGE